jgi:hypothetical protein
MIREVNLIEHLPLFVQEYKEVKQIMTTENPEFQLVSDESETIKNNQFIETCDLIGIAKFESLLNIHPLKDDTLESRISRVMTRWNDVVPYTFNAFVQKLMVLCGGLNFTINKNFNEYKMEIITHLEMSGQVDELQYLLGYMISSNLELISSNEIYCSSNANSYVAAGMASCETFELSDAYNAELVVQGSSIIGGGFVETAEVTISDNYNETITVNGAENVGSGVSYTSISGIN